MLATLVCTITSITPAEFKLWLKVGAAAIVAAAFLISVWPTEWTGD